MIEPKLDSNLVETELYNLIKTVYSGDVYCGNRPHIQEIKLNDYVVIKTNNTTGKNMIANDRVISSVFICSIQIWTRAIRHGFKDMVKETEIRTLIINALPSTTNNYKFSYSNEVGARDLLGFHGKYINLKCTII